MIPNKTVVTLFLVVLAVRTVTSTSTGGIPRPSSSGKPALTRKRKRTSETRGTVSMLQDTTSTVEAVEAVRDSIEEMNILQEEVVPQVNKEFGVLISQEKYDDLFKLVKDMGNEEFLKQLCSFIKTPEQYKGLVQYLKQHKMVASFYVYGDMEVVKEANIIESRNRNYGYYADSYDLMSALFLAFKEDQHDRAIEFLEFRKGITAEEDKKRIQNREKTSFERFVYKFFHTFPPREHGTVFRQFLILRGDELRNKYSDIYDILCEKLVFHLKYRLDEPNAAKLLSDLVGQPSLLTSLPFVQGFLGGVFDKELRSNFIKYGWREVIEEGLNAKCYGGGEGLWQVMKEKHPDRFPGDYPSTPHALAAVCMHFPTKQQKEKEWIKEKAAIIYSEIESLGCILNIFPAVLWAIITEYAVS